MPRGNNEKIGEHYPFLEERFNVKSSMAGSCMRREQNDKNDIGIRVKFYDTIGPFNFPRLETFLSVLRNVGFIMNTLKWNKRISKEALYEL